MTVSSDALWPVLDECVERLGLSLSPTQATTLLAFVGLLQRWNTAYNLTAIRDPAAMLIQHVADSLAVVAPIERYRERRPLRLLDVGSGGGLPGLVIATALPDVDVTCIDTVGKKAAFLVQAAGELGLANLHGVHGRVEQWAGHPFDLVTSRAFASLADFVRLSDHALGAGGAWMAMKGKRPVDELRALPASIDVFHVEQLVVPSLDAERCLVWMRKASGH